jgi:hypothetical protein
VTPLRSILRDMTTKLDKAIRRELEHAGVLYTLTIDPGLRAIREPLTAPAASR